jgi:hypothetical protein
MLSTNRWCLAFVLSACFTLWAQTGAELTGTVTDVSGAVVPHAKVTVTNDATQGVRIVTSDRAGVYDVPSLVPGSYSVAVEMSGFRTEVRKGLVLQVQQSARLDFRLQVGQAAEKVEVMAGAIQLNTENATVGSVIENQRIVDLPLNGRNFLQLVALDANVSYGFGSGQTTVQREGGNRSNENISVAGGRGEFNYYTLDGVSNTDESFNTYTFLPSVDALQEFKIETGIFPAEFGRGLAQVNVLTKPGTNDFHGALYEFVRNSTTDAANYCFVGSCPPGNLLHQNQFGGTVGGPVWIPHVFKGKNKAFFMFNYEGFRFSQGATETGISPTMAQRQGNFVGFNTIYDPATQVANGSVVTASPFPGNVIPASRFDAIAMKLLPFEPLPNAPSPNNLVAVFANTQTNNQYTIRGDYNESAKSTWFGRYSWSNEVGVTPDSPVISTTDKLSVHPKQAVLSNVRTFSPTLVNEFRFGYNRLINGVLNWNAYSNLNEVGALGGIPGVAAPSPQIYGLPSIAITGMLDAAGTSWGDDQGIPFLIWDNSFQWSDTLSKILGKHSLRFGAEIRRDRFNSAGNSFIRGYFSFYGQATQNPASPNGTGVPFADYLLGLPSLSDASGALAQTEMRNTSQVYFFDDTWKATPKLTVSIGLRYDYFPAYIDKHDNIANTLMPAPGSKDQPVFVRPGTGGFYDNIPANFVFTPDIPVLRSSAPLGQSLQSNGALNFAPRLGVAYNVGPKWVIRSGFGIFFVQDMQNINFDLGRNLAARRQIAANQTFPNLTLEEPFGSASSFSVSQPFVLAADHYMAAPYVIQYMMDLQRQLSSSLVLDVGYMGSEGHKLWGLLDHNVPPILGPGSLGDVPGSLRPWPEYGVIQSNSPWVNSVYNSLSVRLTQRLSHGLSFNEAYTYGRSMDDNSSVRPRYGDQQFPQNPYDLRADRGLSDFNIAHRSVTSLIYDLPIGKGRTWMNTGGVANAILGGWQFGTIMTFETGLPIDVISGTDPANSGEAGYERPNYAPGQTASVPNPSPAKWFNTAAFVTPPPYTYGNVGRNTLTGPALANIDLSLIKQFVIHEGQSLQFRAEAFNSLNHPNFSPPQTTLNSSAFGTITSTISPMRQLQFALKFLF